MSWGAIGARTTESQVHRELASGLSCPVGFKMAPMVRLKRLSMPLMPPVRRTASFSDQTYSAIVNTSGNGDCHIILRGGKEPNYSARSTLLK